MANKPINTESYARLPDAIWCSCREKPKIQPLTTTIPEVRLATKNLMRSATADFATGAATWRTERNTRRLRFGTILSIKTWHHLYKPDVHNVSHCLQMRTEPRLPVTYSKIWWNLDVAFEICERTDKQTDKHADTLITVLCMPIPGAL